MYINMQYRQADFSGNELVRPGQYHSAQIESKMLTKTMFCCWAQ